MMVTDLLSQHWYVGRAEVVGGGGGGGGSYYTGLFVWFINVLVNN